MYRILVMNLGGTSTKLAIFEDKRCVADYSCKHALEELDKHPLSKDQVAYRKEIIQNFILSEDEETSASLMILEASAVFPD